MTLEPCWQDWLAWAAAQGIDLPADPGFIQARERVWAASDYVARSVARFPHKFAELIASGDLSKRYGPGELAARLSSYLAEVSDEPGLQRALRCFRRRELIRIIWRDIAELAPLDETLEDLSELAEVCVRGALDHLEPWAWSEWGRPRAPDGRILRLIVLAMGKLGGRELNLSSDIDLIFAFACPGTIQDGPRPLSHDQFFIRLAQRLLKALADITADGFVFRVDARLRPFGEAGPLAMSLTAMEDYYQSQAREWERYAMIKARPIAGDPEDCAALMEMLRPFVYRRYLDFGVFESLRELKRLINYELHRRGMEANIKLGPGGIREIEFIGQALQLVRGGRDPELQIHSIRAVLQRLGHKSLLPQTAVAELDAAYVFLRRVENRLQAQRDQQTHCLPGNPIDQLHLAQAMGYADWASFTAALSAHRERVQTHFDALFAEPEAEAECEERALFAALWPLPEPQAAIERLQGAGFADPEALYQRIEQFHTICLRKGLSTHGHKRLNRIMPQVLKAASECAYPDLALGRVLTLFESIVQRTAYLAMLAEHPRVLTQLTQLAALSPWFTEQIARQPILLDELIDLRRLYRPLRRGELESELDDLLAGLDLEDLEQQMERLRQFAWSQKLRVAAADLTGVIPLMVVSDYLTEIAEAVVVRVLALAWGQLVARHGRPTAVEGQDQGFLVVGYGKLGGIELGYGSDLDLVFLHGSERVTAETDGPKPVSNEQFYARLAQRMIHILTTRTPSGELYAVDTRLRPDGSKGLLVRSMRAFAEYQRENAWIWEHQALVRARPIAGDPVLAERFLTIRRAILCQYHDPQRLKEEVRVMRERMRVNLDRSGGGRFDLKQGRGGIADIEFMVQYAVLRWAAAHPELADWTDNIRLLETLARLALLPGPCAQDLIAAYQTLRQADHRSALSGQPRLIADTELQAEREQVWAIWQALFEGSGETANLNELD
ncbi:bifunctional [glutamate--ammonia ligase]-adenylyl-L-tyrosine phosphorylase/[glutamate--ammonia-ligase] adenylyltransferase [Caldichromatium japonicum]|uniref:Bifunctional glutamine synthetase adenylyltransferase/adenylyl-removing enzyme n=1 Tax=Caldichromatium japonicum TaxID=2699430 RepID=A0A6G7VD16_9GAMM|nr:bifunctional [glutamate--ammonia ligase]-adenylyl-L-tyrosine phosphorylase/[glutamate--ammonia-ligase] adenylyltransferase [Caldichromatium japonicum]QIK37775.1 bifunctional [glutamate--ammonia ligase]-adenylyl-L-tyrosine phosphorylase/[glutamate--ammonia-ligase] adenylyltransferase [Caldichromatium japonicum]